MADYLRALPWRWKLLLAYLLTDGLSRRPCPPARRPADGAAALLPVRDRLHAVGRLAAIDAGRRAARGGDSGQLVAGFFHCADFPGAAGAVGASAQSEAGRPSWRRRSVLPALALPHKLGLLVAARVGIVCGCCWRASTGGGDEHDHLLLTMAACGWSPF